MTRNGGVYKITNILNNKCYIGSTTSFNTRFNSHKHFLRKNKHPNSHLQNAWNLYGENNFVFEILEKIEDPNEEILLQKEQYFADLINPQYNLLKIVKSCLGYKHTEETKKKHRKYDPETIKNIREGYKVFTVKELSSKYGISPRYIRSIVENKRWYDENYQSKLSNKDFRKKISKPKMKRKSSKLNYSIANAIREEYKSDISQQELAKKYNVSQGTISKILLNTMWTKNYETL